MAKTLNWEEYLGKAGFGEKEISAVNEVVKMFQKESEDAMAAFKKKVEDSNDKIIKQEAAKLAENIAKLGKEKYIADLEKAKDEIKKECEAEAGEEAAKKMEAFKESLEKNTALVLAENEKAFKEKALAEAELAANAKIEKAIQVANERFDSTLAESLSMYKAEIKLDATDKLNLVENRITGWLDPMIKEYLQEGLSSHDIKNYVVSNVNGKALAAVMEALESNLVAPNTDGHRLLMEKDSQIAKLQESLGKAEEKYAAFKEAAEKTAKKSLINDELKNFPDEVKAKIEKITENDSFESSLSTVRAMSEAIMASLNEAASLPAGTQIGSPLNYVDEEDARLSSQHKEELAKARKINEMFAEKPDGDSGIVQECNDSSNCDETGKKQKPVAETVSPKTFGKMLIENLKTKSNAV